MAWKQRRDFGEESGWQRRQEEAQAGEFEKLLLESEVLLQAEVFEERG